MDDWGAYWGWSAFATAMGGLLFRSVAGCVVVGAVCLFAAWVLWMNENWF